MLNENIEDNLNRVLIKKPSWKSNPTIVETYPNNISFIKGIEDKNGIRSEKTEIANNKINVATSKFIEKNEDEKYNRDISNTCIKIPNKKI